MSTSEILTIGSVIRHRGSYNASTIYYTNNQVTMCNCVFQAIGNNFSGVPPIEENSDGTIKLANTVTWKCIVDNVALYNAALSTNNLDSRLSAAEQSVKEVKETADEISDFMDSKGTTNGIAPLDENSQVPSKYLPNSVNDVLEFNTTVQGVTPLAASTSKITGIAYDTVAKTFYAYVVKVGLLQPITYYKNWTDGNKYQDEVTGVPYTGKIYMNVSSDALYRWTGTDLERVGEKKQVVAFNGIVSGVAMLGASTESIDGVAYDDVAKRFCGYKNGGTLLVPTVTYYKNWPTRSEYEDTETDVPYTERIYVDMTDYLPYIWNGTEMKNLSPKTVALTQDEYDALVSSGLVDENTYYNVLEDE